jgi:hypothetical protein
MGAPVTKAGELVTILPISSFLPIMCGSAQSDVPLGNQKAPRTLTRPPTPLE